MQVVRVSCIVIGRGIARLRPQGAAVHACAAAEEGQEHKHEYVSQLHAHGTCPGEFFAVIFDEAVVHVGIARVAGSGAACKLIHFFAIAHVTLNKVIFIIKGFTSAVAVVTRCRNGNEKEREQDKR